jgi:hypothetical protein
MALIGRIVVIAFALVLASAATGIAIAVGVLGPEWHGLSGDLGERGVFWGTAFVATGFTAAAGFLPIVILIALAEAFKIRSLLVHALTGAALAGAAYVGSSYSVSYEESIAAPPPPISRAGQIAAASGAVFGLSYWLLAGRNAGRWREPPQA